MTKYAIIVAGGSGMRAGGEVPKQFQGVAGVPMLLWSIRAFREEDPDTRMILVVHPDFREFTRNLLDEYGEKDITLALGGITRSQSVRHGLQAVPQEEAGALVAIHDAARPLVSPDLIRRGWDEALAEGAAIPVTNVTDSLREKLPDGKSCRTDRSRFMAVQTPQVFRAALLHQAYSPENQAEYSDDAAAVEATGHEIATFIGETENFKVTHPHDFLVAETLLNARK